MEGRLGLGIAIEEETVVDALPGPVIEPTAAVAEAPEGDAIDVFDVGYDGTHGLAIGVGLFFEDLRRATVHVGIDLGGVLAGFRVPIEIARDDIDNEFGEGAAVFRRPVCAARPRRFRVPWRAARRASVR